MPTIQDETIKAMEQYTLTLFVGAAKVSAAKCGLYEEIATSPEVKRFFHTQRATLMTTIKRLHNMLAPKEEPPEITSNLTDLDLLLDWHKDTVASGASYFSAANQAPDTKLEQEFIKQAVASKVAERETRDLMLKLGGKVV